MGGGRGDRAEVGGTGWRSGGLGGLGGGRMGQAEVRVVRGTGGRKDRVEVRGEVRGTGWRSGGLDEGQGEWVEVRGTELKVSVGPLGEPAEVFGGPCLPPPPPTPPQPQPLMILGHDQCRGAVADPEGFPRFPLKPPF
jgi:hypothetical protein